MPVAPRLKQILGLLCGEGPCSRPGARSPQQFCEQHPLGLCPGPPARPPCRIPADTRELAKAREPPWTAPSEEPLRLCELQSAVRRATCNSSGSKNLEHFRSSETSCRVVCANHLVPVLCGAELTTKVSRTGHPAPSPCAFSFPRD